MDKERISILSATLILAAVIFITRLITLWVHIVDVDEAIWAVMARSWIAGGIPYIDFSDNKPLGIIAFMAGLFKIFGTQSMIIVHAATMLVVLATSLAIMKLAELLSNRTAGFIAALLYAVFSTNYIPKVIATNIETIINFPLVLAVIAIFIAYRSRPYLNIFWAGMLVGLACVFKYQAGIMAIYISIVLMAMPPRANGCGRFRSGIKSLSVFALGSVLPFFMMIIYLNQIGAMNEFIGATLSGSVTYISKGGEGFDLLKRISIRLGSFLAASSPLWIFAGLKLKGLKVGAQDFNRVLFMGGWIAVTAIAVLVGWRLYGHYFILWLPPLSVLAGIELAERWRGWKKSKGGMLLKVLVVAGIAIITIGFAIPRYFLSEVHKACGEDDVSDYIPIAVAVDELTGEGDKIFVWGYAPAIYYYSDRLPAYRFLWSDRLTGRHSRAGKVEVADQNSPEIVAEWRVWLADIEKHDPELFIDTSPAGLHDYEHYPISNYKVISEYMGKRYELIEDVGGALIYRKRNNP